MSGDPSVKEPLIFYSEEMTDTKISLLELHGIQLRIKKNNFVTPTVTTPAGEISETLMSGALGDYYADKREY